jgi:hypothetical protein
VAAAKSSATDRTSCAATLTNLQIRRRTELTGSVVNKIIAAIATIIEISFRFTNEDVSAFRFFPFEIDPDVMQG